MWRVAVAEKLISSTYCNPTRSANLHTYPCRNCDYEKTRLAPWSMSMIRVYVRIVHLTKLCVHVSNWISIMTQEPSWLGWGSYTVWSSVSWVLYNESMKNGGRTSAPSTDCFKRGRGIPAATITALQTELLNGERSTMDDSRFLVSLTHIVHLDDPARPTSASEEESHTLRPCQLAQCGTNLVALGFIEFAIV
jgi:hypothetical protein